MFLHVHNVEVKTVDKHRLDEKDSRYSEIRVKGVQKGVRTGEINDDDTCML